MPGLVHRAVQWTQMPLFGNAKQPPASVKQWSPNLFDHITLSIKGLKVLEHIYTSSMNIFIIYVYVLLCILCVS